MYVVFRNYFKYNITFYFFALCKEPTACNETFKVSNIMQTFTQYILSYVMQRLTRLVIQTVSDARLNLRISKIKLDFYILEGYINYLIVAQCLLVK